MFDHLEEKKEENKEDKAGEGARKGDILLKKNLEKISSGISSALASGKGLDRDFDRRLKKLEEKGRKRGRRFSFIGILGGSLITLAIIYVGFLLLSDTIKISGEANTRSSEVPDMRRSLEGAVLLPTWQKCANDGDCLETQKDCCGCREGGEQTAINAAYFEEWNQRLFSHCGSGQCAALMNCRSGEALCNEGRCVFEFFANQEDIVASEEDIAANEENSTSEGLLPDLADRDNDGLSDSEEALYGTDPDKADTDGDGYSDSEEIRSGYDPLEKSNQVN